MRREDSQRRGARQGRLPDGVQLQPRRRTIGISYPLAFVGGPEYDLAPWLETSESFALPLSFGLGVLIVSYGHLDLIDSG